MTASDKLRNRVKAFRRAHDFTLRTLAEAVGLSNAFISQFENGKTEISYENALKLDSYMVEVGEPAKCEHCDGGGWK